MNCALCVVLSLTGGGFEGLVAAIDEAVPPELEKEIVAKAAYKLSGGADKPRSEWIED